MTASTAESRSAIPTTDFPDHRGHYVYVLVCADGSLYTGYTVDVAARLAKHTAGKGAKYTRARRPLNLVLWWEFSDRGCALSAEASFKRLDRRRKLAILEADRLKARMLTQ